MSIVTLREPDDPEIRVTESIAADADTNMYTEGRDTPVHKETPIDDTSKKTALSLRDILSAPAKVVSLRDADEELIEELKNDFKAMLIAKHKGIDAYIESVHLREFQAAIRVAYRIFIEEKDLVGMMYQVLKELNIQYTADQSENRVYPIMIRLNGYGPMSHAITISNKKI